MTTWMERSLTLQVSATMNVADGEFYVGLTLEKAAVQYKDDPSVGFVYPKDGTSAVPDGVALVKGCPE